jgi:hypothetical protein
MAARQFDMSHAWDFHVAKLAIFNIVGEMANANYEPTS